MEIWEKVKNEWNRVFKGTEHESNAETSDELLDQLENTPQMKDLLQAVSKQTKDDNVEAFNTQFNDLKGTLESQKNDLSELTGKITTLEETVGGLKTELEEKDSEVEELKKDLAGAKDTITELQGTETKPPDRSVSTDKKKDENNEDEPLKMSFNEFRYGNSTVKK